MTSPNAPAVHRRLTVIGTDDTALCGRPNSDTVGTPGLVTCPDCIVVQDNRARAARVEAEKAADRAFIQLVREKLAALRCTCDEDGSMCDYHFGDEE